MEILDTGDTGKVGREHPGRGATADLVADLDADLEAQRTGTGTPGTGTGTGTPGTGTGTPGTGTGTPGTDTGTGTGQGNLGPERRRLSRPADEPVPRSLGTLILSSLTSADTLGLAAILLELITLSGGYQLMVILIPSAEEQPPWSSQSMSSRAILEQYTLSVALCVAPSFVLALAGLFRLRAQSPAWVRAAVGASVIIAVLLVGLTAAALWHISGMPQDLQPPTMIGG
jgi:hypothetical protein